MWLQWNQTSKISLLWSIIDRMTLMTSIRSSALAADSAAIFSADVPGLTVWRMFGANSVAKLLLNVQKKKQQWNQYSNAPDRNYERSMNLFCFYNGMMFWYWFVSKSAHNTCLPCHRNCGIRKGASESWRYTTIFCAFYLVIFNGHASCRITEFSKIEPVHFVARNPLVIRSSMVGRLGGHIRQELHQRVQRVAVGRRQQLDQVLDRFHLQPPVAYPFWQPVF